MQGSLDVPSSTTTTTLPEIPLEIFAIILSYVALSSLSNCCRLDKHTHSTAFNALYCSITPTPRNILEIASRLSQPVPARVVPSGAQENGVGRPELLATKVRSFVLVNAPGSHFEQYLSTIRQLLPKMRRLSALTLELAPTSGAVVLPALTEWDACTESGAQSKKEPPFSLRSFRCTFFYNEVLEGFLRTQPSIRYLVIRGMVTRFSKSGVDALGSHNFLPDLRLIQAHWKLVCGLVPGRPVSSLIAWDFGQSQGTDSNSSDTDESPIGEALRLSGYGKPSTIEEIACLSNSTAPRGVDNLFMNWMLLRSAGGPNGKDIANAVPKLSKLSIQMGPFDAEAIDELSDYFSAFLPTSKTLQSIFIRFQDRNRVAITDTTPDFSAMLTNVFAVSARRLRDVVITYRGSKMKFVRVRDGSGVDKGKGYTVQSVKSVEE